MTNEKEKFRQDLLDLGVTAGDVLLVHSSMKALGTKLSPEEVLQELEAAVGEDGTLLLPALTYENVTEENPVFDSKTTEPCIGLLPKTFMPAVMILAGVLNSSGSKTYWNTPIFARGSFCAPTPIS